MEEVKTPPKVSADPAQLIKKSLRTPQELAALEAAHARAHKRLTAIELVATAVLVFAVLAALAGWAYYQQVFKTSSQPYSVHEYQ